jgi:hypothetical protein
MVKKMRNEESIVRRQDHLEFLEYLTKMPHGQIDEERLICSYFHPDGTSERAYFEGIAHRAYLDLNRTLRGIGSFPGKQHLHDVAISALRNFAFNLRGPTTWINQETFDKLHREMCLELCGIYVTGGWKAFSIGQAQKWLNMTFKYVFTLR